MTYIVELDVDKLHPYYKFYIDIQYGFFLPFKSIDIHYCIRRFFCMYITLPMFFHCNLHVYQLVSFKEIVFKGIF